MTVTPGALKQFGKLPNEIKARVLKITDRLVDWPEVSGPKALSGDLAGFFRMRTGDYRVQFIVTGEEVLIVKVGHRDGFYGD